MEKAQTEIARVFEALGDPTRRAIVERLTDSPASVSGLAAPLDITLTAVGQHLQVLEESGLVQTEKLGRVRTARLNAAGFLALERWLRDHRSAWERRLDRLGDLLAESDEE
ncbi:MAG TPA: metalloregulator ArsR/SmtB family transcription factor [Candidatus Angelobacter sp.]|jgi:DNA-binding transcriptional ArsR family regulator|nr:metalloregulator ArsR/SmtB family transcription factor [Candidatus Angelobacter sp.]